MPLINRARCQLDKDLDIPFEVTRTAGWSQSSGCVSWYEVGRFEVGVCVCLVVSYGHCNDT